MVAASVDRSLNYTCKNIIKETNLGLCSTFHFFLHNLLRYFYFEIARHIFKGNEFRKKETICCKCESRYR